ncbi:hypothetical protein SK128_009921 [Halocaridina rubra]|uniref:Reverse transcriptase domain-containing protein n=1 Tax=Halocaridina rubra TaxID=373956 RepID=A0AAN8XKM7_HALRR
MLRISGDLVDSTIGVRVDTIGGRNHCTAQIRRFKVSFITTIVDDLNSSPTDKCLWSLAETLSKIFCNSSFPPLIHAAKDFKTLLNFHFLKRLESNSLIFNHQYGFLKARSTGDLLSYLTHVWSSSPRNYGESFVDSVLSPTLFPLFINDLLLSLSSSLIHAFADDLTFNFPSAFSSQSSSVTRNQSRIILKYI